jgi:hypothetical protein
MVFPREEAKETNAITIRACDWASNFAASTNASPNVTNEGSKWKGQERQRKGDNAQSVRVLNT